MLFLILVIFCPCSHFFRTRPNHIVVYTVIFFTVVTIGAVLIEWLVYDPFLQYFTLFYGVFFGYYAIRDIWDDT